MNDMGLPGYTAGFLAALSLLPQVKTNFRKNLSAINIELCPTESPEGDLSASRVRSTVSLSDAFCSCKMHIVN